jgi:tumor protein p53-inducible protein 3
MGQYNPPPGETDIMGLEASGVIAEVGKDSSWTVGQRAMCLLAGGSYAEHTLVHEQLLMPVPQHLSLTEAAAIPEAWLTAFQVRKNV